MPAAAPTHESIAEMALSYCAIDGYTITDVDGAETDKEQVAITRFYRRTLKQLLELHPWTWAQRHVTLTLNAEATDGDAWGVEWLYAYDAPADYLSDGHFISPAAIVGVRPPWRLSQLSGAPVIFTNVRPDCATFQYTAEDDTAADFPEAFVDALALSVAVRITPVLNSKGNARLGALVQQAEAAIANARAKDTQEGDPHPRPDGTWINSRHGYASGADHFGRHG